MKIRNILNGLTALVVAGSILLISDLENRKSSSEDEHKSGQSTGLYAQKGRTYKIGLTYFAPDPTLDAALVGLWNGMKQLGFVKDSNLVVLAQHANGEISNLQSVHLNMDNEDIEMILVTSTPGISAAVSTVTKHPMVFSMTYTPLEAGAGKSNTDHLPNITGVGSFPPVEKTIDFIQDVFPKTKRIGTLYNSSEINSVKVVEVARKYLEKNGITLIENTVVNSSEVFQAASALCMKNIDVMWVSGDNTALQSMSGIAKVCMENKIPLILNDVDYVKMGALAAVGIGWYATGLHTAPFVARVLNGDSPAEIPIENFVEEQIVVNPEIAEKLKVTIPQKYLEAIKKGPVISDAATMAAVTTKKQLNLCLIHYIDSPNSENVEKGIRDELKEQKMVEERDFTMKVFNAQGDNATLNSICESVAGNKWDLIFASSTPTIQLLAKKVKGTPIVFSNVGDPIRAGLGESFRKHLPNLTGISTMSDFTGLVNMVIESLPGLKTIGTVFTPGEVNSVAYKDELEKAAAKRGLKLVAISANSSTEVADAAQSLANRGIQAFTQISDNLTASSASSIIKAAYDAKIPYFGFISEQIKSGAVAVLARDYYYAGRDAGVMAIKIFNGKAPDDIPFEYVSKTSYMVNREAMHYFGIKIPAKYIDQSSKNE
ncbi:MAG: ABC transporter substrate-binding protein [Macellibacteroides fermentans]|uniref:ABC transporter substrate-binding protein n=1 Tax=Macellibacteroides fermentans TaxID=879969 RepID=UPI003B735A80